MLILMYVNVSSVIYLTSKVCLFNIESHLQLYAISKVGLILRYAYFSVKPAC